MPLRAPDPDVVIDLSAALARVYELGAYSLRVNYQSAPPPPALPAEDAAQFDARLRTVGLR